MQVEGFSSDVQAVMHIGDLVCEVQSSYKDDRVNEGFSHVKLNSVIAHLTSVMPISTLYDFPALRLLQKDSDDCIDTVGSSVLCFMLMHKMFKTQD